MRGKKVEIDRDLLYKLYIEENLSMQEIADSLLRQKGFDQLFGTNYGEGTSNEELMKQHGFVEVYDTGQSIFIWNNESSN